MYPNGFKIGNSVGRPGMPELQKEVVKAALMLLTENTRPGEVITKDFPDYGEFHEPVRVGGKK